ncbi:hypothetical protein RvY_16627 [Ramazzottius varieornatus]|uniref:DDB1- and CUL4-associated factor 11 n=1 Tax=Ramazzottius varieornatus TaxID=947166 RepID=A0A1D1VZ65_RAMVA|nr:hypothetical protein RvY_16627 [Ramazzottius varieornatus]
MGARASRDADDDEDQEMNEDEEEGRNLNHEAQPEADPRPARLEPRRHQGGHRGADILNILESLYRSGQLNLRGVAAMPGRRGLLRNLSQDEETEQTWEAIADMGIMDKSDYKQRVLANSGLDGMLGKQTATIPHYPLLTREYYGLRTTEKVRLMHKCIPNSPSKLMQIDEKLFCGLHSQDGEVFLASGQDQCIRVFDTSRSVARDEPLKLIRSFDARDVGWSVLDVRLSSDGRYLAYSSWSDAVHIASVRDDSTHLAVPLKPDGQHCGVFSLMFSHDDTEILAGANFGHVYVVSLATGRSQKIKTHSDDVNTVAFADNTSHILYSGGDDGIIRVWDRRNLSESNPKCCGLFLGHKHGITYLDPHADGRHLLSNSKDQSIKLWDIRCLSNEEGLVEAKKAVQENRWDYRYRYRQGSGCARKLKCDRSIITFTGHSVLQTLIRARFSPYESTVSRYIYTGDNAGHVIVFDTLTGETVRKMKEHMLVVRDVSWHPSRPEIISTGWDGLQVLWTYRQPNDEKESRDARETVEVQSSEESASSDDSDEDGDETM